MIHKAKASPAGSGAITGTPVPLRPESPFQFASESGSLKR